MVENYIGKMDPVKNILDENWTVEFEGGYVVNVLSEKGWGRNRIMMMARNMLSQKNRHNFNACRASGGRILKCYKGRR